MVFSYAILIGISLIYYSTGQTDISKAFMIINIYNTDPSLSILLVLIHLFIILFTNCIYIAYSHHQIYILIHFVSLLILLFTSLIFNKLLDYQYDTQVIKKEEPNQVRYGKSIIR